MTEAKERVTLYIPTSLKEAIIKEADVAGQNLSIWVERALAHYLKAKVLAQ